MNKFLKLLLILLLLVYISTYYISTTSYYEYHLHEQTILTNEKIKEFENDLKNNENIDLKEYLPKEDINYSNNLSNLMYNLSTSSTNLTRKILKYLFNKLNYLVED